MSLDDSLEALDGVREYLLVQVGSHSTESFHIMHE